MFLIEKHVHYPCVTGSQGVCAPAVHWTATLIRIGKLATGEAMSVTLKDFYADWCGPCKTQDPILEDLAEEWDSVEFEKINVDEEQEIANEYQVRSLPTLIVENDDGVVERFVGVTQANDIEDALESAGA